MNFSNLLVFSDFINDTNPLPLLLTMKQPTDTVLSLYYKTGSASMLQLSLYLLPQKTRQRKSKLPQNRPHGVNKQCHTGLKRSLFYYIKNSLSRPLMGQHSLLKTKTPKNNLTKRGGGKFYSIEASNLSPKFI